MPVTPTYPGVYIEEIPSGVHTITGVATSVTAFIGYTAQGPVNSPIEITNYGDFERNFGGLDPRSDVSYSVQQFFLNGGGDAWVVRVAKNAAAARIELTYSGGSALVVTAANAGAWGNRVRLDVDYDTSNPDSTFNLRATRYDLRNGSLVPAATEQYRNLSMNNASAYFAPNVVNNASKLIRLDLPAGLTFDASKRGWSLSSSYAAAIPSLQATENTITGVLDGQTPFTLVLPNANTITDWATLTAAFTAAISNAGLASRLSVDRADAKAAASGTGTYLKLTSAATGPTSVQNSSVEIVPAPTNDASAKLGLGLQSGGREQEGAAQRRPYPNGALSLDLADLDPTSAVAGQVNVTVADRSTSPATTLETAQFTFPATATVADVPTLLQGWLAGMNTPAAQQATVERFGSFVRVVGGGGGDLANVTIAFSNAGATAARLTGPVEPEQYSLGPAGIVAGSGVGNQANAVTGADGDPPDAGDIIGSYNDKTGLYALRNVDLFNLLVVPEATTRMSEAQANSILAAAQTFCEQRRAFLLVDPFPGKDRTTIGTWASGLGSRNAAVFYPRIEAADPLQNFRARAMPPSGAVAGVFARTDASRGVWKAPAGIDAGVRGVQQLEDTLTDEENGQLNPLGVNVIRTFPVYGTVIWGARTLEGDDRKASEWKYIPIRRLALMIEESLFRGTKWVVFEPNDEPLWAQIRLNVGAFMHNLFRQGAFQGKSSREAYFVKCDAETTTQNDRDLGIVNIVVGFAPLKPAEFVVIQIQQIAGQIET
jgi:Bacteriophage tail sheath protein